MTLQRLGVGKYKLGFYSRGQHAYSHEYQSISAVVLLSDRVVVKLSSGGRRHWGTLSLQLHDLLDNSPCDLWTWRRQQEERRMAEQKVHNGDSVTANGVTLSLESHGRRHSSWATLTEMEEADVEQLCQRHADWSKDGGCYLPPMDLSSVEEKVEAGEGKGVTHEMGEEHLVVGPRGWDLVHEQWFKEKRKEGWQPETIGELWGLREGLGKEDEEEEVIWDSDWREY
ncbi:hypothetical protein V8C86DRAFT_3029079 [Haematococcus lacustris]